MNLLGTQRLRPYYSFRRCFLSSRKSKSWKFPWQGYLRSSSIRHLSSGMTDQGVQTDQASDCRHSIRAKGASQSNINNTTLSTTYEPPRSGILSLLPASWIPYAELVRLDKPAGTIYLYLPCLFSTSLAAIYTEASLESLLLTSGLFFAGAQIMRGAGCTINDLWDRHVDPLVTRTRFRPIARGAVSVRQGIVFAGAQCLAGLAVLVQFPTSCLYYGIPSLLLVVSYPLAKRVTDYPQVILGTAFSWGALMGFPALGVDLLSDTGALKAALALYASCIAWTVSYDMIYAFQDIKDDANAGVRSIARRHQANTRGFLASVAALQVGMLAVAGTSIDLGPCYFAGTCGATAGSLAYMIYKVRLDSTADCLWWFTHGTWITGAAILSGMVLEFCFNTKHTCDDHAQGVHRTTLHTNDGDQGL